MFRILCRSIPGKRDGNLLSLMARSPRAKSRQLITHIRIPPGPGIGTDNYHSDGFLRHALTRKNIFVCFMCFLCFVCFPCWYSCLDTENTEHTENTENFTSDFPCRFPCRIFRYEKNREIIPGQDGNYSSSVPLSRRVIIRSCAFSSVLISSQA